MDVQAIERAPRRLAANWEKLVLLGAVALLVALGAAGWSSWLALTRESPRLPFGLHRDRCPFADTAWNFLEPADAAQLPADHAFTLHPPSDWRQVRNAAPPAADDTATEATPRNNPPATDSPDNVLADVPLTTPPTPSDPASAPPATRPVTPPTATTGSKTAGTHLRFAGYVATENGSRAACLVIQHRTSYVRVGEQVGSYILRRFEGDALVLASPAGDEIRLSLYEQRNLAGL